MKDLSIDLSNAPPRSIGALRLGIGAASRMQDFYQQGALKALFPRSPLQDRALEATLINTSGGITGGDILNTSVTLSHTAKLTLSTQACERIYRASDGVPAQVITQLTASDQSQLHWLPQETLFYDGGRLNRQLDIRLSGQARLLAIESLLFGRLAMGETHIHGHYSDTITLRIDDDLVWQDRTRLSGAVTELLDRPAIAAGARATALLLFRAPEAEAMAGQLPALLNKTSGLSYLGQDLLVIRILAPDGLSLRRMLFPILSTLSGGNLPRCWRL
ncbi:MAG TPA: urease accessory protein [Rhodobacteraceae bacterium]|jgi:urease accessory protein|nr:urease accessory protein [Paracoccaceae bacterium]